MISYIARFHKKTIGHFLKIVCYVYTHILLPPAMDQVKT